MSANGKQKTLVVVQLTGGNDFMNTIVPYNNPHYYDARKTVVMKQDEVLPINDELAMNPNAAPFKRLYDEGKMAIIQGIGYPNSNRSHFRGMDIWHTAEPDRVGNEGWLGQAVRELDPNAENVLTGVNIGMGLPRAMSVTGVPVTSIGDLEGYGVMTRIEQERLRDRALEAFKGLYGQAIGSGAVAEYIGQTGLDVLKRRGHARRCRRQLQLRRGVRRQPDCQEHARCGAGASGRPRYAHLLHIARRLRHPRQRNALAS